MQEVLRAHVEHAAFAFHEAKSSLDAAQEVRLADAVRADDGDDVRGDAGAHGETPRETEGDAVRVANHEGLERLRVFVGDRGGRKIFIGRVTERFVGGCLVRTGKRHHIVGNALARLDAHAAAIAVSLVPGLLDEMAKVGLDARALMLAGCREQHFAIHFGDKFELRQPGIELHVAKTAAQRCAHVSPDYRNLVAVTTGPFTTRRRIRARIAGIRLNAARSSAGAASRPIGRKTRRGLLVDHGPSSTLSRRCLPFLIGHIVSPTAPAPEPQNDVQTKEGYSLRRRVFSLRDQPSTDSSAAADELFFMNLSWSVLPPRFT